MMMKNLMALSFAGFMYLGVSHAAGLPHEPAKNFFNETWGDYREELKNAKDQGKEGLLLFFEMKDCPFCRYMETKVFTQPEVQEFFQKHFLIFTIDIEGDIEVKDFKGKAMTQKTFATQEYRVRATPVIAFVDVNGKKIFNHIGKTTGVEEFMQMGDYVVSGAYKQMPFIRYKQSKQLSSKEKN